METILTSNIVDRQLPDFVRGEHPKFVTFLKKYYEWLESNDQVNYEIERLREANDVDYADSYYLNLLKRDLLPYFPEEILADKTLFLKLVNNFYKANGTQNSIKFLFRALFNDNIEIYYPKEDVLVASDGKWVLPLALRVDTTDNNIFNIEKTLITGSISKATAVVEKVIQSIDRQLGIQYTELYISNIQRLFETGETVTATYIDSTTNLPVTVTGRLVGALSEIKIDPDNRGLFYVGYDPTVSSYPGDPVSIVGGLNPESSNPIGAIAHVGTTTKGSVTDVFTVNGGFGFRNESEISSAYNNKVITLDFIGGFDNAPIGTEATSRLNLIDDKNVRTINVSSMQIETLNAAYSNINVANSITISNITTYQSFNVYSISFVELTGGGGGYRNKPSLEAYSFFNEDYDDILIAGPSPATIPVVNILKDSNRIIHSTTGQSFITLGIESGSYVRLFKNNPNYESIAIVQSVTSNTITFSTTFPNDITGVSIYKILRNDLYKVGSIGRINILDAGVNYANGEIIVFTGGSGYGANAYVNVNSSGAIVSVTINNHSTNAYVLGGEGYRKDSLPTLSINTVSGSNGVLQVAEVLGDGDQFDLLTSRIGSISSIRVLSFGYDYIEKPVVSLRNMDLTLSNVTVGELFVANNVIYQGASNTNYTFRATIDKYNPTTNILRVFDYTGTIDTNKLIKYDSPETVESITANVSSFIIYGDGRAKANASFENGLIRYPGIYLNNDGHLSSDKVLQDGDKYHNFSYEIQTTVDYAKFKKPLNDIAHPVGTKTFATKTMDIPEELTVDATAQFLTLNDLPDSYNISSDSDSVVTTNNSADLTQSVNIGDVIILKDVYKSIANTVNITFGSNTVYGQNSNFINDLQEGDIIYLSSGNTETVLEISNSNYLITQNVLNAPTQSGVTINLVFDEVKTVTFVNANTILVDSNFSSNSNFTTAIIQKVE
jgi:hypothetical protein